MCDLPGNSGSFDGLFGISAADNRSSPGFRDSLRQFYRAPIEWRFFEDTHRAVPNHSLGVSDGFGVEGDGFGTDVDADFIGG